MGKNERYIVKEGSESGHCCFVASVIDTTKPEDPVCECYELDNAEEIAYILNKKDNQIRGKGENE